MGIKVRLAIIKLVILRLAEKVRLAMHFLQFERNLTHQRSANGENRVVGVNVRLAKKVRLAIHFIQFQRVI